MDALNRIALLGLDFDDADIDSVLAQIWARDPLAPFTYIVTPNADHLARLRRNPALAGLYRAAWLCLLDSRLIAHLADRLKLPRPQVVTGADLTAAMLSRLGPEPVAIIGLAEADFQALRARYPQADFIHHQPPMNLLNDPAGFQAARDFGAAAHARFTFIALGSPLQETLASAIALTGTSATAATGIGLCIGAALEFCAGTTPRAPAWMRRAGLEWLHRLAGNPKRFARRYLYDDPPVLLALIGQARPKKTR